MATQTIAHSYGEMASYSSCGIYDDISDLQLSRYDYGYYCRRDGQEFAYRFNEYNPNDTQKVYPLFTNRTITASSGHCFSYSQLGDPTPALDTAGDPEALNYTYTNHTYTGTIVIPKQSTGLSGTTYIYRDTRLPQDAVTYACGPRCMWMWVYKAHSLYEQPAFYQCPISISNVSNTTNTNAQDISKDVARIAAASIALQGRWAGTFENQIWTQYQFYSSGSVHYFSPCAILMREKNELAHFDLLDLFGMSTTSPLTTQTLVSLARWSPNSHSDRFLLWRHGTRTFRSRMFRFRTLGVILLFNGAMLLHCSRVLPVFILCFSRQPSM